MTEPERTQRQAILVVDDEPGIVDVLTAVLEDAGYRVTGASNGQEALARLEEALPDLLLLDFEMPQLDGASTLRRLQGAAMRAIPVVMMSGVPESMVQRRCRGYRAFLRKPFSLDELLETVREVMGAAAPSRGSERGARSRRTPTAPASGADRGAADGVSRKTASRESTARKGAARKGAPRPGAASKKRRGRSSRRQPSHR